MHSSGRNSVRSGAHVPAASVPAPALNAQQDGQAAAKKIIVRQRFEPWALQPLGPSSDIAKTRVTLA